MGMDKTMSGGTGRRQIMNDEMDCRRLAWVVFPIFSLRGSYPGATLDCRPGRVLVDHSPPQSKGIWNDYGLSLFACDVHGAP